MLYGGEVSHSLNFIEGDSSQETFNAGHYSDRGQTLQDIDITDDNFSVRPKKPFEVNSHMWGKLNNKFN